MGGIKLPKNMRQSPAHARSRKQEAEAAERLGGRVTKGSGSGNEKLDARSDLVRLEAKTTSAASFRVTEAMIDKLEEGCHGANVIPILEVELRLGARKVYVIPAEALDDLLERARGNS